MDPQFQAEFRTTLYKKYQEMAFEAFAVYTYWGNRYEVGQKDIEGWEKQIKAIEEKMAALTEDQRDIKKLLKADLNLYQKNIANMAAPMKKLFEKSSNARQQALELLEQAEYIKDFKLATPEEIAANKKAAEVEAVKPPIDPAGVVRAADAPAEEAKP